MLRIAPAAALFACALVGGLASADEAAIAWTKDWKTAQKQARAENKPLLVDFWADWCHWCHELDRTTYRDPGVVARAKSFVGVKVNAEGSLAEAELARQYGVESLPTIAFLTPTGRLYLRRTAYEAPEAFTATLTEAEGAAERVAAWDASLAKDGKDAAALAGLGAALVEHELVADGRDLLGRARKCDQARPSAERKRTRRLLALAEHARGKTAESLKLIDEALALQPPDATEDAAAAAARTTIAGRAPAATVPPSPPPGR